MVKLRAMKTPNKIYQLYLELRKKHGSPSKIWPQWCASIKSPKERELIAIGAILTQRTAWRNAEQALTNLRDRGILSIDGIYQKGKSQLSEIEKLIRPAGFYQSKPRRLFEFSSFIVKKYRNLENFKKESLSVARDKLLSLYGIGPETADTILLYALGKPSFIIDEYTKRLVKRRKLSIKFTYDFLKNLFEKNLPCDVELYQDFHALIIIEEKGEAGSIMRKM